ncbi:hypothetical protein [Methylocystis sp.]|uniref:hypothetical protein n=1 Tax=Methylocystis sp. TaxID=1911079 RepID=UPI003D0E996F
MKKDVSLFSRSLHRLAAVLGTMICFMPFGYAQNFNAPVKFVNTVGQPIYVGIYGPTGASLLAGATFSGGCTVGGNGSYLVVPKDTLACRGSLSWPAAQNKICADVAPVTGCTPASLRPMTIIEVSGTSTGLGYDISVIPRRVDANGVACNDAQWLPNCPYYDNSNTQPVSGVTYNVAQLNPNQVIPANQKNLISSPPGYCASQGPANYNFGVKIACSAGHAAFICAGTPTLGNAKYPSNCGYSTLAPTLNNCKGNLGTGCYQAFFSPMSNGGANPTKTQTGGGLYYCGYPSGTIQPYDQCASLSDLLTIIFASPK